MDCHIDPFERDDGYGINGEELLTEFELKGLYIRRLNDYVEYYGRLNLLHYN